MTISTGQCRSPVGGILLAWCEDRIVSLDFDDFEERYERLLKKRFPMAERVSRPVPNRTKATLHQYFTGELSVVDQFAVEYHGTAFENRVWQALRSIAPGTTATYGELAAAIDSPRAARAVGRANSLNPVAIIVPCHRVIGANAKLTGYAGGLERKKWLLDHERKFYHPPVSI